MTPSAVLLLLADRCEREEPSKDLNFAIFLAVNPDWVDTRRFTTRGRPVGDLIAYRETPRGAIRVDAMPDFGGSLDAAVTLVPEGREAVVNIKGWARVASGADHSSFYAGYIHTKPCKTPALALCAAALRACAAEGF